ncbi:putative serine/threonine-protein kinase pats1 isoform X2 [Lissotriton helveticus]
MAVSQGSQLICRHLIAHGADVKMRNKDGDTCLHMAALKGSLPICQLLLQHEESLAGARDKSGETFLFRAVRAAACGNGDTHTELVSWALERDEDLLCRNEAGLTVLDVSRNLDASVNIRKIIKEKTEEQQRSKLLKNYNLVHRSRLKLFMCGHGGVGKTTLANTLQKEGIIPRLQYLFVTPEAPLSTRGVDITHTELAGGALVIWDFAGQMEYYFTHSLLLATTSHNVIYCLLFSLDGIHHKGDQQQKSLEQIQYWLRFLSVTSGNNSKPKSRVFLIGTHYDKIPAEHRAEIAQHFTTCVRTRFKELFSCFEVEEFYVNCTSPADLETLRGKLEETSVGMMQDTLGQSIPSICNHVMETVAQLCRMGKMKFMHWKHLLSKVRENLAEPIEEEQLIMAVEYLHNISELLYFPTVDNSQGSPDGLVILNLKWLCHDIFGTFGNFTLNSVLQADRERWRRSDLESCLKLDGSGEIGCVLEILEQLELLFAPPGTDEYIVPAWLASERATSVWQDSSQFNVYHGIAYSWKSKTGFFSQAFFARLQIRLLKHFTRSGDERFLIWKDGIKCMEEAEVLVQVTESRLSVNVIVRGFWDSSLCSSSKLDTRSKCWGLLQTVGKHIEKLLAETSADDDWHKLYLSPVVLNQRRESLTWEIAGYTLAEVLAAAEKQETLCRKPAGVEDQPWRVLMAGYDITVLTRLKRCASIRWLHADTLHQLCCLLDPEHPTFKDWRSLMEKIGEATHQDIQTLDANAQRSKCSSTALVFEKYPETSIDQLYYALQDLEREDCLYELDIMLKALEE